MTYKFMHHHFIAFLLSGNKSDNIFSAFAGFLSCVVGVVTFDTVIWPLILAFFGGFLGLLGKKSAEYLSAKIRKRRFRRRK